MGLGAIVVISAKKELFVSDGSADPSQVHGASLGTALECAEVCGRSLVERIVERFAAIDCDTISILVENGIFLPAFRVAHAEVTVEHVDDLRFAITRKLSEFESRGIDHSFINWADAYTETDLLDLFCFHRESRQTATPAFDRQGPLALWVIDCAKAQRLQPDLLLEQAGRSSRYFIREYVVRMTHPSNMRQFAADVLRGRCETAPSGRQSRPGVWCDQGAEVHRRARIVAPAYIGCGSKVRADALVTRLSNIERDCCIDSGTVVEDSSILANTTIGICLDVCHAIVNGNELFNLERDIAVEVSDPKVMRSSAAVRMPWFATPHPSGKFDSNPNLSNLRPSNLHPMTESWQFNGNLVQE